MFLRFVLIFFLVTLISFLPTLLEILNKFSNFIFVTFALNFDFNSSLLKSQVSKPSGLSPMRPNFGFLNSIIFLLTNFEFIFFK